MKNEKETWERQCPSCNVKLFYITNTNYNRAIRLNSNCNLCSMIKRTNRSKLKYGNRTRNCPNCNKELIYKSNCGYLKAIKNNNLCINCVKLNKKQSENTKLKRSLKLKNRVRPKDVIDKIVKTKISKHRHCSDESKMKMRLAKLGKPRSPHTTESKRKIRLYNINRIQTRFGQIMPNYNPVGCSMIEQYGKNNGYEFQHAENGGEYYIK